MNFNLNQSDEKSDQPGILGLYDPFIFVMLTRKDGWWGRPWTPNIINHHGFDGQGSDEHVYVTGWHHGLADLRIIDGPWIDLDHRLDIFVSNIIIIVVSRFNLGQLLI